MLGNMRQQCHGVFKEPIPPGAYIRICVSDNGSGMTKAIRESAMEPFFSTKPESIGSGLGLSMVKEFVSQSGGQLRLESKSGVGTRVSLYLPRSDDTRLRASTSNTAMADMTGDETVLVVDDCDDVRRSVSAVVSSLGYKVLRAASGEAALRLMRSESVDLLFSDIRMPGMTGFELASLVQDRHPEIRILLTSGFTDHPVGPDGAYVEGFDFIPKPYRKQNLAERIRSVLDQTS